MRGWRLAMPDNRRTLSRNASFRRLVHPALGTKTDRRVSTQGGPRSLPTIFTV